MNKTLRILVGFLLASFFSNAFANVTPLFSEFAGFSLSKSRHNVLEAVGFATGVDQQQREHLQVDVLGEVSTFIYRSQPGFSFLSAVKNYENALTEAGFEIVYQCGNKDCANRMLVKLLAKSDRGMTYNDIDLYNMGSSGQYRYYYVKNPAKKLHVNLVVGANRFSDSVSVGYDVVREKSVEIGLVKVNQGWLSSAPEKTPEIVAMGPDKKGASDHPLVSRYPAAQILDKRFAEFEAVKFAKSPYTNKQFEEVDIEGASTSILYRLPKQLSVDQVYRNYLEAFNQAGFESQFSCNNKTCGNRLMVGLLKDSSRHMFLNTLDYYNMNAGAFYQYLYTTLRTDKRNLHVGLIVSKSKYIDTFYVALDIVESKALEIGKITLDLEAMNRSMEMNGRVTLHGLYFDTDSAVLTTTSQPALQVIASYLKKHPQKRFYIVGHTDDSGDYNHNQDLSKRRAASVLQALQRMNIASDIMPVGVGPVAPVSSNRTSDDRAMNRRVELVERI